MGNSFWLKVSVVAVGLLLQGAGAWAKESKALRLASGSSRPPYVFSDRSGLRGIEVEVVTAVLGRMKRKGEWKTLSPFRLEAEVKHGNSFDLIVGVPKFSKGGGYYSLPISSYDNYAFSFASKKLPLRTVRDLVGYRLGVWMNAWRDLGGDFERIFGPKVSGHKPATCQEFVRQEDQFRAFWDGDLDVIVMDRYIFSWLMVTQSERLNLTQEAVIHDIFQRENMGYVHFKDSAMRDHFNRELLELKRNGDYDRIVQNYTGGRLAAMFKKMDTAH